ncbi:Myb-like DNA-binding domain containing protein [Tritrichomonas foetus]|uniref:Myb-like DNA-binding domain containing protein n=1 Tax=Tritrichomonas foetus TaxID=1144522 RepID=A0A1J4IZF3_9EUKA|nr:Myb-like DNA-binding domain containing protein [Tritrichomonas foetus]|eukprot:OHS92798.1 Myb-like DNA-binding domain containing protein [Tritrichomonas foetus]
MIDRSPIVETAMRIVRESEHFLTPELEDKIKLSLYSLTSSLLSHNKILASSESQNSSANSCLVDSREALEKTESLFMEEGISLNAIRHIQRLCSLTNAPLPPPGAALVSNRSGLFQMVKVSDRKWTHDEDDRLLVAVSLFGYDNWSKISQFVGSGRSRAHCLQRWIRTLNPFISSEPWSQEEDNMLSKNVDQFGEHSWITVASKMGNRTDLQCKYRYGQLTNMIHGPISSRDQIESPTIKIGTISDLSSSLTANLTNGISPNLSTENIGNWHGFELVSLMNSLKLTGKVQKPLPVP